MTRWRLVSTTIHLSSRSAATKMDSYWLSAALVVTVVMRMDQRTCYFRWANQTWGFSLSDTLVGGLLLRFQTAVILLLQSVYLHVRFQGMRLKRVWMHFRLLKLLMLLLATSMHKTSPTRWHQLATESVLRTATTQAYHLLHSSSLMFLGH